MLSASTMLLWRATATPIAGSAGSHWRFWMWDWFFILVAAVFIAALVSSIHGPGSPRRHH